MLTESFIGYLGALVECGGAAYWLALLFGSLMLFGIARTYAVFGERWYFPILAALPICIIGITAGLFYYGVFSGSPDSMDPFFLWAEKGLWVGFLPAAICLKTAS